MIDRRDPDYIPPKFTDEELADMYQEHLEEEREEEKYNAKYEKGN